MNDNDILNDEGFEQFLKEIVFLKKIINNEKNEKKIPIDTYKKILECKKEMLLLINKSNNLKDEYIKNDLKTRKLEGHNHNEK